MKMRLGLLAGIDRRNIQLKLIIQDSMLWLEKIGDLTRDYENVLYK